MITGQLIAVDRGCVVAVISGGCVLLERELRWRFQERFFSILSLKTVSTDLEKC